MGLCSSRARLHAPAREKTARQEEARQPQGQAHGRSRRASRSRRSSGSARCSPARGTRTSSGPAATMRELAARASYLGVALPPSYSATVRASRRASASPSGCSTPPRCGRPSTTSSPRARRRPDAERLAPFARLGERCFACFDRVRAGRATASSRSSSGATAPCARAARHFGEWLDASPTRARRPLDDAADIPQQPARPPRRARLQLRRPHRRAPRDGRHRGHRGAARPERTREVRGDVDRLFDSSGKASLTLNVDEFTLAVSLRTGLYVFEPEDVFRWLRWFRDENFFGEPSRRAPAHPDRVRDLRRAPREPPLVLRGVLEVACAPRATPPLPRRGGALGRRLLPPRAHRLDERALPVACSCTSSRARSAARTRSTSRSTHLHVTPTASSGGSRTPARALPASPTAWPRAAVTRSPRTAGAARPRWYGIGGAGDRVLVWGAGALLEFDGERFVPVRARRRSSRSTRPSSPRPAQGKRALRCSSAATASAPSPASTAAQVAAHQREPRHRGDSSSTSTSGAASASSSRAAARSGASTSGAAASRHLGHPPAGVPQRQRRAPRRARGRAASTAAPCSPATAASSPSARGEPVFHAAPPRPHEPARLRASARRRARATSRRRPPRPRVVAMLRRPNAWIWRHVRPATRADRRADAFWVHRRARLVMTLDCAWRRATTGDRCPRA